MSTKMIASPRNLVLATSLSVAALVAPACLVRGQGVAERVGQGLDNAGRTIRTGVQNAFSKTQTAVHNQDLLSRLYSRIHWDKTLVGSTLELEVQDGGTAVLRGGVPDAAAKQRAVLLAKDTVGVTQVVDQLNLLPPARVVPASSPSSAEPPAKIISKP